MNKNFEDIFESINSLHKKYSSKQYLDNLEKFDKNSKELSEILEKYRIDEKDVEKKKIKSVKINKKEYTKGKYRTPKVQTCN